MATDSGPAPQPSTFREDRLAERRLRTLIVGTTATVPQIAQMLKYAQPPRDLIGCVLPQTRQDAVDGEIAVLGGFEEMDQVLLRFGVEQVLVSLPIAAERQARSLLSTIERAGITWRWMPALADQLAGDVRPPFQFRSSLPPSGEDMPIGPRSPLGLYGVIAPEKLLDRTPRPLDEELIGGIIKDQVVMVTGAGGSIGSELVRIVCRFSPAQVVFVERAESPLFEIDREVATDFPALQRGAVLLDITDRQRVLTTMKRYRPHLVLHAAALKHVGLMQDRPAEAIESNILGTRAVAEAASECEVRRFVMISTDKAVYPHSVMGSTKRLAEIFVQHLNQRCPTIMCMVRFGNVLGSVGSVLPIWSKQLAAGLPLTVTDPEMTRYFMTIPEAAGLVLQAAAMSGGAGAGQADSSAGPEGPRGGGEVFLLDMGDPVNILEMAHRFIRAHGLEPDRDIPIVITGARPGEKLHEELLYDRETLTPTAHPSIRLLHAQVPGDERVLEMLKALEALRAAGNGFPWQYADRDELISLLRHHVEKLGAG
ncbi:MAG: polysaccharide biosynthesis protein [Phycisphaeraceae bacterium]|nr:polysaccharide biosynthesis protein [Phycisphaeraceae bacterium]